MNDKQKDILLNAIGYHLTLQYKSPSPELRPDYERRIRELLAAFDAAADAPKRKYTVADIKVEDDEGFRRVWCREYGWTDRGWVWRVSHVYSQLMAEVIRAGLVATGNVPEVGE